MLHKSSPQHSLKNRKTSKAKAGERSTNNYSDYIFLVQLRELLEWSHVKEKKSFICINIKQNKL